MLTVLLSRARLLESIYTCHPQVRPYSELKITVKLLAIGILIVFPTMQCISHFDCDNQNEGLSRKVL